MKRTFTALGLLGLFIAGSIGTQLGIDAAKAAFWQWSLTPANNGSADPTINWSEGMPPSVVNDSARAMMTRLVEQGLDTSGKIVTTGTSTAYTATSNQGFPTPTPNDGQVISVRFHVTNGVNPTLSVDGGTAYAIVTAPGLTNVAVGGLIANAPYTMTFILSLSQWALRDVAAAAGAPLLSVPLGAIIPYTGTTVPSSSWAFANGQCLSQTTYATYYALLGSPGTGGCAAGQFHIYDARGFVLAGLDNMGGAGAAGRLTNAAYGCGTAMTVVGAVCGNGVEYYQLTAGQIPLITGSASVSGTVTTYPAGSSNYYYPVNSGGGWAYSSPSAGCCVYVPYLNSSTGTQVNYEQGSNSMSGSTSSTNTAGGSSGAGFPKVPPTAAINYIIRVL